MIGSSLDFLIRSILFRIRNTGALRVLHQIEHEPVALARRLGRIDDQAEHVDLADRVDGRVDHPHVHPVQRPVDARRVEEDDLRVRIVPTPRIRVRVVCGLSETIASFVPDQPVQQRRLAGVGRPMNETKPDFHDARSPSPAPATGLARA